LYGPVEDFAVGVGGRHKSAFCCKRSLLNCLTAENCGRATPLLAL
jgi:hypothetical protein